MTLQTPYCQVLTLHNTNQQAIRTAAKYRPFICIFTMLFHWWCHWHWCCEFWQLETS